MRSEEEIRSKLNDLLIRGPRKNGFDSDANEWENVIETIRWVLEDRFNLNLETRMEPSKNVNIVHTPAPNWKLISPRKCPKCGGRKPNPTAAIFTIDPNLRQQMMDQKECEGCKRIKLRNERLLNNFQE